MIDALTIIPITFAVLMMGICLRNWRSGVFGLLAFMPYTGIPTILLYPAPPMTRLLKDVIFLIPAYFGFVTWYLRRRPPEKIPKLLASAGVLLTALVIGHMFDDTVPELMVALVGLKTWALYIPLIVLGYHLVRTIEDLEKLARWLLLVGALPVAFGVIQAVLVYAGASDLAYRAYGAAASDVTHGFGRTEVGTGDVVKVASIFTFVSQYYNFVLATLCLAYGRWRSLPRRSALRFWFGLVPLTVVALAGLLTGSRGAFVMIPLFFIVVLALGADWMALVQVVFLLAAGLTTALTLFKTTSGDLFDVVQELAIDYLTVTQIGELKQALSATVWGLGTGTNTGPARLVVPDRSTIILENYYAKAVMELGVPGLVVVVLLFTTVVVLGFRRSRALANPVGKAYANSLLAFLIISVVNAGKASYLDLDPLNVYFWLYAGVLLRIPQMTTGAIRARGPAAKRIEVARRPPWNMPALPTPGGPR
jgi:hypothetical protein